MRGEYQDRVQDGKGRVVWASDWRPNTIVDSAWSLIAGLLRNDPALDGILFWAVGTGSPAWDGAHVAASAAATRLQAEAQRQAIPAGDISYLDEDGTPAAQPTTRLEVRATFGWDQVQTLREFGLFGGDATTAADSGRLINYVIHPRIDLAPGAQLNRRLRFTLRPDEAGVPPVPAAHWLGAELLTHLSGVGASQATAFANEGITTLEQLAAIDPGTSDVAVPLQRRVELRARARLVLRTVARLSPPPGLLAHGAWQVARTPAATLAADAGVAVEVAVRLKDQVDDLAAALSSQFLQGVTIGELAQPG